MGRTQVLRPVQVLPPCSPSYHSARAIYVERIPTAPSERRRWRLWREKVYVRGQHWHVRRNGKMTRLDREAVIPAALDISGVAGIHAGFNGWYPSVDDFLRRAVGADPAFVKEEE